MTFVAGRALPPQLPPEPKPWIPLTKAQRHALDRRTRTVRELLATPLVGADGLAEWVSRPEQAGQDGRHDPSAEG
jgi:dihydroorotase